jgi:DNA-binding GntR family transcriptional regulator
MTTKPPTAREAARNLAADLGDVTSRILSVEAGCSLGVARSTLSRLCREGWLRRIGRARYVCSSPFFYRAPDVDARIEAALLLSGQTNARHIAARAGFNHATALRHLHKLQRIGRAQETDRGWEAA